MMDHGSGGTPYPGGKAITQVILVRGDLRLGVGIVGGGGRGAR